MSHPTAPKGYPVPEKDRPWFKLEVILPLGYLYLVLAVYALETGLYLQDPNLHSSNMSGIFLILTTFPCGAASEVLTNLAGNYEVCFVPAALLPFLVGGAMNAYFLVLIVRKATTPRKP